MADKCINTEALKRIAQNSAKKGYNRLANPSFLEVLDPEGWHLLTFETPHNAEWRTIWFCKVKGLDEPQELILDMSDEDFSSLGGEETIAKATLKRIELELLAMDDDKEET